MKTTRSVRLLPLMAALALGGCSAGAAGPTAPGPQPEPSPGPIEDARGVPGFDTRTYPGDETMAAWLDASPYRWVGYYLPAPCYTGTSWVGKRDRLRSMGWGTAVLFVGEQDWPEGEGLRVGRPDSVAAAMGDAPRCTRSNLTRDKGRLDGAAAGRTASAEGFPAGTVVYLDVERVERVSAELRAYVQGWTAGLLEESAYSPGLYAHADNAEALIGTMEAAAAETGAAAEPRLWVASTGGFNLRRAPAESGYPATIWQGRLDVSETWGGHTLTIDANVADSAAPSS